jgi:hypothetical protein
MTTVNSDDDLSSSLERYGVFILIISFCVIVSKLFFLRLVLLFRSEFLLEFLTTH